MNTPAPNQSTLHGANYEKCNWNKVSTLHAGLLSLCSLRFQVKYQWLHFRTDLLSFSTKTSSSSNKHQASPSIQGIWLPIDFSG